MKNLATTVAAQNAASAAIPAIVSPPVPAARDIGPQTLLFQKIVVPAQQRYPVQIKGNYIYIEGLTQNFTSSFVTNLSDKLTIKPDTANTPIIISETYRELRFPQDFSFFEINNGTNLPVTITFYAGFGQIRRDYEPRYITTVSNMTSNPVFVPQVLAAGKVVGNFSFSNAYNIYTQRGRIQKATVFKNNTNAADVSLYLFNKNPGYQIGDQFEILPAGMPYPVPISFLAVLRFPSFLTTSTSSTTYKALSDLSDIDVPFLALPDDTATYPWAIYGVLVANTPYTIALALEEPSVILTIQT